ncbi:hypothetical protein ABK905_05060 [Acerihabitans sp. KWT182]|uniref:Uncharacterized protein n=1 Tax=Acerihabitans sp. KWT182 TaxID=3157919 RepID=A0AAU7QEF4_9GAMM
MGKKYLSIFDPTLEITSPLRKDIMADIYEGAAIAGRACPDLKNILSAMLEVKIEPTLPLQYEMAFSPSIGLKVPVVKLGGDTFHGKEIYLRVNPADGDILSRKYTLSSDKNLEPVPMPQGEKLHNIRIKDTRGMGAKV